MKVTGLKYQVKNPDRVNIHIDGRYSFSLTVGQVIAFKLTVGSELDDQKIEELKSASFDGKLLMRTLRWCYLRPRSEHEVRTYLRRTLVKTNKNRDTISEKIESLINELINAHAFDDRVFAEWWLQRSASTKKSLRMLEGELRNKGIDQKLIKEKLQDDDTHALYNLIQKNKHKSKYADHKKFIAFLMGKGFRYSSIVDALADGTKAGD